MGSTVYRTSGGTLDVSSRTDSDERAQVEAWLDSASQRTGVHRDAIINECARVHGGQAHFTRDMILEAAASLVQNDDDVFRSAMQARLGELTPNVDASERANTGARVVHLDTEDDSEFSAYLARKAAE